MANRQERGCDRQHRECSRVDRISGCTDGRAKRTKSGPNTCVVPVSYSCRTKQSVVLAILERQKLGVKATIWWFCHDHERSGRSSMIGNIGKEWSAQCDLGLRMIWYQQHCSFSWSQVKWYHFGESVFLGTMFYYLLIFYFQSFCVLSLIPITILKVLTHWGQVTHICVSKLSSIGSDNGLSPGQLQAII